MKETGHPKPDHLVGYTQEDLKGPTEALFVKGALGEEDICSICGTASEGCIGHDDDDSVLLFTERPRVEIALDSKELEFISRHPFGPRGTERVRDDLGDIRGNNDVRLPHREQHVQR